VIWELDLMKTLTAVAGVGQHTQFKSVSFAPGGKYLAYGGFLVTPSIIELQTQKSVPLLSSVGTVNHPVAGDIYAAAVGNADSIYLQDVEEPDANKIALREFKPAGGRSQATATALALSSDCSLLAAGHIDEAGRTMLEIWNVAQRRKHELHGHTGPIRHLTFLDRKTVVSAADDGTIRFWNATAP
jgi:WD40 repeat protein